MRMLSSVSRLSLSVALAVALAFAALAPGEARAQDPGDPHDATRSAWAAFTREHGGGFRAEWSQATGTPVAIWGNGLRLPAGPALDLRAARAHALAVIEDHAALLGRGPSTFVERIGVAVQRVYVFVYEQRYRGLRVVGGRADVRIHDARVVAMFGARAVPIPAGFDVTPRIDAEHARALALDHLGIESAAPVPALAPPVPELVVWADVNARTRTTPRLCWEIDVDQRPGRLVVGRVFVDARTGAVLAFENDVHECGFGPDRGHDREPVLGAAPSDGRAGPRARADLVGNVRAWANVTLGATDPLSDVPLERLRVRAAGGASALTDQNGDFVIPYSGQGPVAVTVELQGQHVSPVTPVQGSVVTATLPATPGVPVSFRLLMSSAAEFDRAQTSVYWWTDFANEFVRGIVGNTPQMDWIDAVKPAVNINASCNAFYTRNSINFYARSGSCNNTGFSTVVLHEWGHGLDDAFGSLSQIDGLSEGWGDTVAMYGAGDPVVGRGFRTNGGSVRSGLNTRTYPAGGGVHQQGQTWMGFNWDVRQNLSSSMGSAGIARAEAIVIGSIVANAFDQPSAVREVFILDDDDGVLANGTPHYAELSAAALKRTLPFPERLLGRIEHAPLTSAELPLTPRIVRAQVVPYLGSFQKVELHYDLGSGAQRRELVPAGGGGAYLALVPGAPSPATVAYHIEAAHSSGAVLRFPVSGEIDYQIGRVDTWHADDFESGSNGWTHSGTRTADWALGAPQGRSGTATGYPWRDPAFAVSGQNVWGNNLAGTYQVFNESSLVSPAFDLTGRLGVRLRFQRWLGVARVDTASIRVNQQTVWSAGGVDDSAWTLQEIRIPQADNNSAVTVDWGLVSSTWFDTAAGWNLDDVALCTVAPVPLPAVQLRFTPAQVPLGAQSSLSLQGTPNAPVALLLSASPGPTAIPGLPVLAVGAAFVALPAALDAQGALQFTFTAPQSPMATGALIFAQAIEVSGATLHTSNPSVVLFGK